MTISLLNNITNNFSLITDSGVHIGYKVITHLVYQVMRRYALVTKWMGVGYLRNIVYLNWIRVTENVNIKFDQYLSTDYTIGTIVY